MKKVPLLPNVITAFGLSCGLFIIFKVCMMEAGAGLYPELLSVVAILLIAAFADVLDGAVARAMNAQSTFGGIFDSLADCISFGVAPSVMVLKSLSVKPGSELSFLVTTAVLVFSVCGVLRLVRYSTTACEAKIENPDAGKVKKSFTGLPIPAGAAAAVSANLFMVSPEFRYLFSISTEARAFTMFLVMVFLGYLMVSRWKFPAFNALHVKVASFQVVFLTAMSAVFLFYGILYHFAVALFIISWAYVLVSWSLSVLRLLTGARLKTLEDFEPEPEENYEDELIS